MLEYSVHKGGVVIEAVFQYSKRFDHIFEITSQSSFKGYRRCIN